MDPQPDYARSFAAVADAYHRARPGYPREAVRWLTGAGSSTVLELGAGTGKLTAELVALGHRVVATDPLAPMLGHLARTAPGALPVRSSAEEIPLRHRSIDVVVAAQAFHWFDLDRALPEMARVLRPSGTAAFVWNLRDDRIPWVRRLGELIGTADTQSQDNDPTQALLGSRLFGYVESETFRWWQPLTRDGLRDLVTSRSAVAVLPPAEREDLLDRVGAFYDEFGRGHDGMLLPYVTHCYKATVKPLVVHPPDEAPRRPPSAPAPAPTSPAAPPDDPDEGLLIRMR